MKKITLSETKQVKGGGVPIIVVGAWVMGGVSASGPAAAVGTAVLSIAGMILTGTGLRKHYKNHH